MPGTIPFPDGEGSLPDRRSKRDVLIDEMFQVLPAKSAKEIQERLLVNGENASLPMIEQAIAHLRKWADYYGWSIPHVKRGPSSQDRCYFRVLKEKTGRFIMDVEHRKYVRLGFRGTLSHTANMGENEALALRMVAQFERSRAYRERAIELAGDMEYVAKKARSLLRQVNGEDVF